MNISEAALLADLLGVLEPGDQAWLTAHATAEHHLRAAGLAACAGLTWKRTLPALQAVPRAADTLAGDTVAASTPGSEPLPAEPPATPAPKTYAYWPLGDRLVIPLTWAGARDLLERARIVVFREAQGRRGRIFPMGTTWPRLTAFRWQDDRPVADIVLTGPRGRQRFDVVLLHESVADQPWEDDDPRWERLYAAGLAGLLPACTVEIDVG